MVLEDTTMEEALWALGQVQGPCHITLRPSQDGKSKESESHNHTLYILNHVF